MHFGGYLTFAITLLLFVGPGLLHGIFWAAGLGPSSLGSLRVLSVSEAILSGRDIPLLELIVVGRY